MVATGNNSKWNLFVLEESSKWKDTVLGWLLPQVRPVLLVRYEDLKLDPRGELKRMLAFLGVPYIREQLELVVQEKYEEFRRPHVQRKMEGYFTRAQKAVVKNMVLTVQGDLQLDLSGYLEQ